MYRVCLSQCQAQDGKRRLAVLPSEAPSEISLPDDGGLTHHIRDAGYFGGFGSIGTDCLHSGSVKR